MQRRGTVATACARLKVGVGALIIIGAAIAAVTAGASSAAAGSSATATAAATSAPPGGFITDFAKYAHALKHGSANPNLAPVKIGWSSVDNGGSVQSIGPEATPAAEVAVKWLNKYADGIDGHPIVLDECIILNAEEEGL